MCLNWLIYMNGMKVETTVWSRCFCSQNSSQRDTISHFLNYDAKEQLTGNRVTFIFPEGKFFLFQQVMAARQFMQVLLLIRRYETNT